MCLFACLHLPFIDTRCIFVKYVRFYSKWNIKHNIKILLRVHNFCRVDKYHLCSSGVLKTKFSQRPARILPQFSHNTRTWLWGSEAHSQYIRRSNTVEKSVSPVLPTTQLAAPHLVKLPTTLLNATKFHISTTCKQLNHYLMFILKQYNCDMILVIFDFLKFSTKISLNTT